MISNYIICATPRSGSNLLCELLCSLGFAGIPGEHLWDPPGTDPEPLGIRWPRVLRAGTGANGVFGLKIMWYQADLLERELPDLLGRPGQALGRVFAGTLENPKYGYLNRRDRLRQAISLVRAIQTSQWRSMDPAARAAQYDAHAITREVQFFEREEATWQDFFERNEVVPYRLSYEDLIADPQQTIAGLLSHLGFQETLGMTLSQAQHRRQADEVTEEWLSRYEREL